MSLEIRAGREGLFSERGIFRRRRARHQATSTPTNAPEYHATQTYPIVRAPIDTPYVITNGPLCSANDDTEVMPKVSIQAAPQAGVPVQADEIKTIESLHQETGIPRPFIVVGLPGFMAIDIFERMIKHIVS